MKDLETQVLEFMRKKNINKKVFLIGSAAEDNLTKNNDVDVLIEPPSEKLDDGRFIGNIISTDYGDEIVEHDLHVNYGEPNKTKSFEQVM